MSLQKVWQAALRRSPLQPTKHSKVNPLVLLRALVEQEVKMPDELLDMERIVALEALLHDVLRWIARGFKIVMAEDEVAWADEFEPLLQRAKALGIEPRKDVQEA